MLLIPYPVMEWCALAPMSTRNLRHLSKTISMLATTKVMTIQVEVTIRWNMVNQIFNLIIYETIQFHTEQLQDNNCEVQFNREGKLSK